MKLRGAVPGTSYHRTAKILRLLEAGSMSSVHCSNSPTVVTKEQPHTQSCAGCSQHILAPRKQAPQLGAKILSVRHAHARKLVKTCGEEGTSSLTRCPTLSSVT
jgi:hypothetical protein